MKVAVRLMKVKEIQKAKFKRVGRIKNKSKNKNISPPNHGLEGAPIPSTRDTVGVVDSLGDYFLSVRVFAHPAALRAHPSQTRLGGEIFFYSASF
ncbi:MAG: hypothetical protein K2Q21_12670 [Chitinophagaceae bacterium]|nr:hypothetical protein [Chitinophagaceae bacterium]